MAREYGKTVVIDFMLENNKVDVNYQSEYNGMTGLMFACYNEQLWSTNLPITRNETIL